MLTLPRLVTPPAAEPVSLAEAKAHLRVDHADDDALIGLQLGAARQYFDGFSGILGRCLINQGWRIDLPGFPADCLVLLPFPDVSAVSIAYWNAAGVDSFFDAGSYAVHEMPAGAGIVLRAGGIWPETDLRPDAVRISFTAGFGVAPTDIPATLRTAILLRLGDLYRNREAGAGNDTLINALIAPFRCVGAA